MQKACDWIIPCPDYDPLVGERRVKEHCIQRGLAWDDSLASTSCQEQEYYEDLLRFYRYNYRVGTLLRKHRPQAKDGLQSCRCRCCTATGSFCPACSKHCSARVHRSIHIPSKGRPAAPMWGTYIARKPP